MTSWKEIKLGDVVHTLKGAAFKSNFYVKRGVPIVRVSDFTEDSISTDNIFYYSEDDATNYQSHILKAWDILIQTVGSWQHNPASIVGKVVKVPQALSNSLLNQNIVKIIPTDEIDNKFLFYRLRDEGFKLYNLSCAQGAANQASITLESIKKYTFFLPPLPTQRRIASILSAYDDLIENNLKRIKLLEELAQRTYEEWFVKFRINGEPLPIDEKTGLPEGWEVVKLSDVCTRIQSGGTPSRSKNSYWENGTVNWFKTKELQDSWLIDSEEKINIDALNNSSAKTFPQNTILMAIYASPTLGRLGLLQKESSCNQAAIGFICKEGIVTFQWLYFKLYELRNRFNGIARGAGQQNISGELVKDQTFILPKFDIIKDFTCIISSIMSQQLNLQRQNLSLKESRDILLPRLMSGKINVE